jgi:dsRNA-specific ribonuclease
MTDDDSLEKLTGHPFDKKKFLEIARIRRSYLNEHPAEGDLSMEPLATLGDGILRAVVTYRLWKESVRDQKKLTEGYLSQRRDALVRRENTKAFAKNNRLEDLILWGGGERKDRIWDKGTATYDMVTEALIGAVFLDAQETSGNGLKVVEDMLDNLKFFDSPQTSS